MADQACLGLVAWFDQFGGVDLLYRGELGHLALGAQHVLGDLAAHATERDADGNHIFTLRHLPTCCRADVKWDMDIGRGMLSRVWGDDKT